MKSLVVIGAAFAVAASPVYAQSSSQEAPATVAVPMPVESPTVAPPSVVRTLPAGTILNLTPLQEISSRHIEEGERYKFSVVNDVVESGQVVIPRGATATGLIKWKTGRAIGGKSGKFDVEFETVSVGGRDIKLMGTHRQEGRGNTVGALLGSIFISGRSAVMLPGQMVNAMTEKPATY